MKNKLKSLLLSLFVLPCMFFVVGCDDGGDSHEHAASETYSYNTTHHWHTCTIDDCEEELDKAEHEFSEWENVKAPAHGEEGEDSRSCACGYSESRVIKALNHTIAEGFELLVETDATELAKLKESYICSECDIPVKGHVLIKTAQDFEKFATLYNNAQNGVFNYTSVKVANDINLGSTFTPLGTKTRPFKGFFDGQDKEITISGSNSLFGYIGVQLKSVANDAVNGCDDLSIVKNLVLSANLERTLVSGDKNFGALALVAGGNVEINNITLKGSIKDKDTTEKQSQIAGLIGAVRNDAYTGSSIPEGMNKVVIKNCTNLANVESMAMSNEGTDRSNLSATKTAGFVGLVMFSSLEIKDCVNGVEGSTEYGCITANQNNDGTAAFIGHAMRTETVTIENCINYAPITINSGNGAVAGFIGKVPNISSGTTIKNCVNYGSISLVGVAKNTDHASSLVGGFVGRFDKKLTMVGCINEGALTLSATDQAGSAMIGGLAAFSGSHVTLNIQDCASNGKISVQSDSGSFVYVGGIVGSTDCDEIVIDNIAVKAIMKIGSLGLDGITDIDPTYGHVSYGIGMLSFDSNQGVAKKSYTFKNYNIADSTFTLSNDINAQNINTGDLFGAFEIRNKGSMKCYFYKQPMDGFVSKTGKDFGKLNDSNDSFNGRVFGIDATNNLIVPFAEE